MSRRDEDRAINEGAEATRQNWDALKRVAIHLFERLHLEHPEWTVRDLCEHLDLPPTRQIQELASAAGIAECGGSNLADQNKILRAVLLGATDSGQIAKDTGLPADQVEATLEEVGVPFGSGQFGHDGWPGGQGEQRGQETGNGHIRRVSDSGQVSFMGNLYGVGSRFKGRLCRVEDAGESLIIHIPGSTPITFDNT